MSKRHLQKWVTEQNLRMREKAVLGRLAAFADPNTLEVWALVKTLAKSVGASERTVQLALKRLKELGVIVPTGRHHKHRGGRWVPIYRLSIEPKESHTEEASPSTASTPVSPQPLHPSEGQMLHPYMKEKGSKGTSPSESEAFKTAFSVYPRSINTKRSEASNAWIEIAARVEEPRLVQAVWTFAGEWKKHERAFNARGMQRWLREGDYENYLPKVAKPLTQSVGNVPDDLLQDFARKVCPDLATKYLKFADLDDEAKTLRPRSNFAGEELLRAGRRFFADRGIVMLKSDGSLRACDERSSVQAAQQSH